MICDRHKPLVLRGDTQSKNKHVNVDVTHFLIMKYSHGYAQRGIKRHGQSILHTYHIFTVKYVLFTYAIQAQVLCTYRDTNLESCISSKFVKIHISLGRYGHISHPHITPHISKAVSVQNLSKSISP